MIRDRHYPAPGAPHAGDGVAHGRPGTPRKLGAHGQHWTEYTADSKHVEYMAFPRVCALAEVLWTPREERNYADFRGRLDAHLQRLAVLDVGFRRP